MTDLQLNKESRAVKVYLSENVSTITLHLGCKTYSNIDQQTVTPWDLGVGQKIDSLIAYIVTLFDSIDFKMFYLYFKLSTYSTEQKHQTRKRKRQ